eukprot:TRINITY_DN1800_c0_g2_i1.p1 TRINITY_DN1800_c0_g2~~TRINITY_DN1800_c0_g2_i1.p1  ORF type:complete len:863 (-),score=331.91 TRINITY_DN1800_c0_g2_i1:53-2641(-)
MTSVKVVARFRPINGRERQEQGDRPIEEVLVANYLSKETVEIDQGSKGKKKYNFDRVFPPDTRQQDMYDESAKFIIDDLFKGYHGTMFAYGQTGAGKSYSMFGASIHDPNLAGVIPRSAAQIFETIYADEREDVDYQIQCSFLEIYNEKVNDLLDSDKEDLRVVYSKKTGVVIEGLTEITVCTIEEIMSLLTAGEESRTVAATEMNGVSSRSHSVFIVKMTQKQSNGKKITSTLNLVDLAGSEKLSKTGASGDQMKEGISINSSLSALGSCINAIVENKKHIPFRDSQLTKILQEALGGNCKTTLMIAASPHIFNCEETVSTMEFGKRAKRIKLKAKVNQVRSAAEMLAMIDSLEEKIKDTVETNKKLQKIIDWMKSADYDPNVVPPFMVDDADGDAELNLEDDNDDENLDDPKEKIDENVNSRSNTPSFVPKRMNTPVDCDIAKITDLGEIEKRLEEEKVRLNERISNIQKEIVRLEGEDEELRNILIEAEEKLEAKGGVTAFALESVRNEDVELKRNMVELKEKLESVSNEIMDKTKEVELLKKELADLSSSLEIDVDEMDNVLANCSVEEKEVVRNIEQEIEETNQNLDELLKGQEGKEKQRNELLLMKNQVEANRRDVESKICKEIESQCEISLNKEEEEDDSSSNDGSFTVTSKMRRQFELATEEIAANIAKIDVERDNMKKIEETVASISKEITEKEKLFNYMLRQSGDEKNNYMRAKAIADFLKYKSLVELLNKKLEEKDTEIAEKQQKLDENLKNIDKVTHLIEAAKKSLLEETSKTNILYQKLSNEQYQQAKTRKEIEEKLKEHRAKLAAKKSKKKVIKLYKPVTADLVRDGLTQIAVARSSLKKTNRVFDNF